MEVIDTALRLIVIGQLSIVVLVASFRSPPRVTIPIALLMLGVSAYLLKTTPVILSYVSFMEVPLHLLTMSTPYLVWACAWSLFDFERPHLAWMIILPSITAVHCGTEIFVGSTPSLFNEVAHLVSLIAVAHAVASVLRGNLDDLLEPRRRFRVGFVVCTALLTAYILLQEMAFQDHVTPQWVEFSNVILIGLVAMALSVPLLTQDLGDMQKPRPVENDESAGDADFVEQRTQVRLLEAMDNRAYARTGLTIRHLAEELETPEHQLRKLINQSLGHRNFSTFLNGYRIEETCKRLEDPAETRIPILTIALDAGFASLAPFNRAFKTAKGVTPSEYRRAWKPTSAVVKKLVAEAD